MSDTLSRNDGRRVGVVVIGTGFIADQHLAALRTSDRADVVAVVDTDAGRAALASYLHGGVPFSTDLDEALANPHCDAAIVCTPNDSHAPIALACAGAGKHLLMEKPMAVTVDEARAIRDAYAVQGLALAVAHTHRAYDYSRAVKDAIDAGDIGRPELIRLAFLGGWIWGDWRAWVTDPKRSGGHPLHNGVHLLDTVSWWMGERPEGVYARGHRRTDGTLEIDDYLEMTLAYPGGGVAVCEMSRGHRPGRLAQRDVLVVGDRGTIALPNGSDTSEVVDESGAGVVAAAASDAFTRQLDAWLDAMTGGEPLASGDDGVYSVAMAVATDRSIDTGEPVAIADVLAGTTTGGVA